MSRSCAPDIEMDMDMDNDNDNVTEVKIDGGPLNQTMLALAAHPLNSCNPPPKELPDLFDSLIASEGRLRNHITNCDNTANALLERLNNLKNRLLLLQGANANFKREARTTSGKAKVKTSEERLLFEAKERVLKQMCFQVTFLHHIFIQRIKGMASMTIKAHHDILEEFLGERHDHAGIEIANSTKLSCIPECQWYQQHGPYEWSKKPFSNLWWQKMNHTDWDWLRMKDHITAAVSVGEAKVNAMCSTCYANAMKFIPCWFWAEDFETWKMHAEFEPVKDKQGQAARKIIIKVRFNKSAEMIEHERLQKIKDIQEVHDKNAGREEAESQEVQPNESVIVAVDKIGETVLDETLVFDGTAQMPGARGQGPQSVRWLSWWGFEKWYAEASKGAAGSGNVC